MSKNHMIFLLVVIAAIAFTTFQKVGKHINAVGDQAGERFH